MCINSNADLVSKERSKTDSLVLWKVIQHNNKIGLWRNTYAERKYVYNGKEQKFQIGVNVARSFDYSCSSRAHPGEFCCFTTRKSARRYQTCASGPGHISNKKIIKVYADRKDIIHAGYDSNVHVQAISVSKMEIRSLKHQR